MANKCLYFRSRHKSRTQIFTKVSDLPAEWDVLVPAKHFLARTNLLVSERARFPDIQLYYVVEYLEEQLIGCGYFQLLHIHSKHYHPKSSFGRLSWKVLVNLFRPKLLVAGHLFRHDIESFYSCFESPYEQFLAYRNMIELLSNHINHVFLLIKDMPLRFNDYFLHQSKGFRILPNDISMVLDIRPTWLTMNDYVTDLKHKYSQRYRNIVSGFDHVNFVDLTLAQIKANQNQLMDLYHSVAKHQETSLGFLSDSYFALLKEQNPEEFKIYGFYKDEQLFAFFSFWLKNEEMDMFYIGFDYESNQKFHTYFNLLFFSIEQAINQRCKRIIFGRTALEAKARLGCKPIYLNTFFKIRNQFLAQWINRRLDQNVGINATWEQRNPLKDLKV